MKLIRIAQDTIINGALVSKGQIIPVGDDFDDPDIVDKVISTGIEKQRAALVAVAVKKEESRKTGKELKAVISSLADLDIAKEEAKKEKDEQVKKEKLKQIQEQIDAAEARKAELEKKLNSTVAAAPVEEPPAEDPVDDKPKDDKEK